MDPDFGNFRRYETVIWVILDFGGPEFWNLEKYPHLRLLKIPKSSLSDTQMLRKIKFDNIRRSKTAILVISEYQNLDFWEYSKI